MEIRSGELNKKEKVLFFLAGLFYCIISIFALLAAADFIFQIVSHISDITSSFNIVYIVEFLVINLLAISLVMMTIAFFRKKAGKFMATALIFFAAMAFFMSLMFLIKYIKRLPDFKYMDFNDIIKNLNIPFALSIFTFFYVFALAVMLVVSIYLKQKKETTNKIICFVELLLFALIFLNVFLSFVCMIYRYTDGSFENIRYDIFIEFFLPMLIFFGMIFPLAVLALSINENPFIKNPELFSGIPSISTIAVIASHVVAVFAVIVNLIIGSDNLIIFSFDDGFLGIILTLCWALFFVSYSGGFCLLPFLYTFIKGPTPEEIEEKIRNREKAKALKNSGRVAASNGQNYSSDGYIGLVKTALLTVFFGIIWVPMWIYKTTRFLNNEESNEYYKPGAKLALCMFIPFYFIYWWVDHATRLDNYGHKSGTDNLNLTSSYIILLICPIVGMVVIQKRINQISYHVEYEKGKNNPATCNNAPYNNNYYNNAGNVAYNNTGNATYNNNNVSYNNANNAPISNRPESNAAPINTQPKQVSAPEKYPTQPIFKQVADVTSKVAEDVATGVKQIAEDPEIKAQAKNVVNGAKKVVKKTAEVVSAELSNDKQPNKEQKSQPQKRKVEDKGKLLKLKALLADGVITEEDFEKSKEMLEL